MSTDRILFQHPDALELFCRIVCKFDSTRKKDDRDKFSEESITLNSLTSNDTFRRVITFYSSEERCDRVSDAIYNVDQSKKVGTSGAKVIYTLSKAVRFKEPFSFVEGALSPILKYLNDGSEQKETYKPKYSTIEVWKPEFKERLYENTVWNLFYRDTQIAKSKSEEDIHGIVNAYLHLQQFSKAEIYNFNVDQDVTLKDQKKYSEEYEGYYEFYNNQNYILFNLKTKSVNEKNLRMEVYVGVEGLVSFALGQWHNINNSIYSGTMILTRIEDQKISSLQPKFISFDDKEKLKAIPEEVVKYFKDKRLNSLRVKPINKLASLVKWFQEKELLQERKNKDLEGK